MDVVRNDVSIEREGFLGHYKARHDIIKYENISGGQGELSRILKHTLY